jgi:hypothetical protein
MTHTKYHCLDYSLFAANNKTNEYKEIRRMKLIYIIVTKFETDSDTENIILGSLKILFINTFILNTYRSRIMREKEHLSFLSF